MLFAIRIVFVFLLLTPLAAYAQDVLVCGPGPSSDRDDVIAKLSATGVFSSITGIDCHATTPTLVELQAYDAVLTFEFHYDYVEPSTLGDNLADYVDGGGGVVVVIDGRYTGLTGRFQPVPGQTVQTFPD